MLRSNISGEEKRKPHREYSTRFRILEYFSWRRLKDQLLNPVILKMKTGNSLEVQWLGLHTFTAEGVGSIPGQGTKILQAAWCGQKIKNQNNKDEDSDGRTTSMFYVVNFNIFPFHFHFLSVK